jgi:hypothetical protein
MEMAQLRLYMIEADLRIHRAHRLFQIMRPGGAAEAGGLQVGGEVLGLAVSESRQVFVWAAAAGRS